MLPCGPPSGGMAPSRYNAYPPLQHTPQYSPNPQMGPMNGNYPYGPPVPSPQNQAMMQPGYPTPPQMPSNYTSPGFDQVPKQQGSYVADWVNPNAYNYSPVPSVAPSVMSLGGIPCDGSTMSLNSNMYNGGCATPDMRPGSVLSSAPSYSENMDPRYSMIPGMPPPMQPQQRPRPTFPQLLGNVFQNEALRGEFIRETYLLRCEVQKLKMSGQKIPESCYKYAQLLPRILIALGFWNLNPAEEGWKLGKSYDFLVANLPEEVVVQELITPGLIQSQPGQDPAGAHIKFLAKAAVSPSFASILLTPLDTILGYQKPSVSLRAHLRNDEFFNEVLLILASPNLSSPYGLKEHMNLISILRLLATNKETRNKLMQFEPHQQGRKVLPNGVRGIIGILFRCVHRKILPAFSNGRPADDTHVLNSLRVVRQLIELLVVLGSSPFSISVANEIVVNDGLAIIASYVHYMFSLPRGSADSIVRKGLRLLALCTQLKGSQPYASALLQLPNKEAFLERILDVFVRCEKTEDTFIISQLSQIVYNVAVALPNIEVVLLQEPFFTSLVKVVTSLFRATVNLRCTRDDSVKWKKYTNFLDSNEALIFILGRLIRRCEGKQPNVSTDSVRALFSVAVAQIGDVPTWTEFAVVSLVHCTVLMAISMFKVFGKTEHLNSMVLLNTFNSRQENLVGSAFSIINSLAEVVKEVENKILSLSQEVAQKLTILTPATFDLLTTIWKTYKNPQFQTDCTVRSNLIRLIINYTPILYKWLSGSEGKNLKVILSFFETVVCEDEIASNWSSIPDMVNYFNYLSSSQEAELARVASSVQSRISRSSVPLSAEVFNAMDYDNMDAQQSYF